MPRSVIVTPLPRLSAWRSKQNSAPLRPRAHAVLPSVTTMARIHGRPLPEPDQVLGHGPSFAFVGEPETNGVAERFFRTFKEQVIHGRIYRTIDDVRAAVRKFFELYNAQWLIEKNGLRSPRQTRFAWEQAAMNNAA